MRLLDLFSGIGGFSLGLERAGFQTVAFCEIDPWCWRVLAKHWPGVPCYDDVRQLDASRLRADGIERVAAICGGFPCQDISLAGKGAGLDGERSGLWREFRRLICDLRPRYVFVENVGALSGRGLAAVLADLAALGYDAEWHAIPAAAVGAPHLRDRVWIVGHQHQLVADTDCSAGGRHGPDPAKQADRSEPMGAGAPQSGRCGDASADAVRADASRRSEKDHRPTRAGSANRDQRQRVRLEPSSVGVHPVDSIAADATGRGSPQLRGLFGPLARALAAAATPLDRTAEPPLRRVDDGIPARLDKPRLKALGNAVVPAIPEIIGCAVVERYGRAA